MTREEKWATSVHNLVLNFRDALVALTPYMDRANIGWRDEEAYDDWDEVAQSLYKNMVIRSVLFSIEDDGLTMAEYDMVYTSYEDKSFIEVVGNTPQENEYLSFVGFSTLEHPFDQVRYQLVSGPDLRAAGSPACMQVKGVSFRFIVNKGGRKRERLSDILVQL
jgi:hypothetical protein